MMMRRRRRRKGVRVLGEGRRFPRGALIFLLASLRRHFTRERWELDEIPRKVPRERERGYRFFRWNASKGQRRVRRCCRHFFCPSNVDSVEVPESRIQWVPRRGVGRLRFPRRGVGGPFGRASALVRIVPCLLWTGRTPRSWRALDPAGPCRQISDSLRFHSFNWRFFFFFAISSLERFLPSLIPRTI